MINSICGLLELLVRMVFVSWIWYAAIMLRFKRFIIVIAPAYIVHACFASAHLFAFSRCTLVNNAESVRFEHVYLGNILELC
jgi:hypothetical protein